DTANYEHPDLAKFEYKEQWARNDKFKEAGILGLLGSGFDPGVKNVFLGLFMWVHMVFVSTILVSKDFFNSVVHFLELKFIYNDPMM
ncbi:hypothetical protein VWM73_10845, partial [Campylobacter coli]